MRKGRLPIPHLKIEMRGTHLLRRRFHLRTMGTTHPRCFANDRFLSHLAMPSASRSPPKGRHIRATMRANQPLLVLAPVGEKPPSTVSSRSADSTPTPTMLPPHWSS